MKTQTDKKTKAKVVTLEGYESRRLDEAAAICDLFAGEGITEATKASAALDAFIIRMKPVVPVTLAPEATAPATAAQSTPVSAK